MWKKGRRTWKWRMRLRTMGRRGRRRRRKATGGTGEGRVNATGNNSRCFLASPGSHGVGFAEALPGMGLTVLLENMKMVTCGHSHAIYAHADRCRGSSCEKLSESPPGARDRG